MSEWKTLLVNLFEMEFVGAGRLGFGRVEDDEEEDDAFDVDGVTFVDVDVVVPDFRFNLEDSVSNIFCFILSPVLLYAGHLLHCYAHSQT